ncbi:hypothetical protein EPUL_002842, partial [Erysiphe pulchra]
MPTSSASINSNHHTPPGPPPKVQAYVNSAEPTSQLRTPTPSTKSNSSGRRNINPSQTYPNAQPLSQIEKSVTHLLVATKQLLETLTQWSRQQASDAQVSDVYVRLGYEFNLACRAFAAINVDTSDLGNVPELLRTILESTLSQEASVESLENYLPRIRDIIINLLHGLKRKQQKLRHKQMRDANGDQSVPRNISAGSGVISSSGSITVENPATTDETPRNREYRSGTPTNNVTTVHNASSSSTRRGQTPRDQVPPVAVKEENFPPPPPPPPKNTDIKANEIKNPSSNNEKKISSTPPPPLKDLTLFLQYKTKVKKFTFSGGCSDLSIARIQLAFIEKFAWNTHHNGVDLPEIYIQDPVSGIRHELEDLSDIKDRSVLVLNVEALDEVKRHIDDGLGGIKKMIENVKTAVDDQQVTIQRVSDCQQDTAKEISRIQTTVSSRPLENNPQIPQSSIIPGLSRVNTLAQQEEVQAIRRDLAILRQSYSSYQSDVQNSLNAVRKMAENVKVAAAKACLPDMTSDSGRKYVNDGKKGLDEESDKLVAHVDDLQDTVEDLRKDVVLRGVRPLPRQLESVSRDIALAGVKLKRMKDLIKREKPIWTKIWEKELERVCKDQEDMTIIEELIVDLEDDLTKASQTFALVEEATKEQLKDPQAPTSAGRAISRGLNLVSIGDPVVAKEGVLDEVRALQPNHEDRLEAIERAEKLRARELESRRENEFEKELENFVEEGKLRKSGGYEEADRARQVKDERIRLNTWDKKNGMKPSDAVPGLAVVDTENIE